ncbi:hypothetical protein EDD37DRAFT_691863 [Exophiala viscosa]|uniref:uncharacterized protein n=1 Tax=Exophiala viscosa TaxID=2486360 RepID=UPI0021A1DEE2|nr:hypothetical protein EDD37DRAFT_691863 [Exophiala viscosa]
MRTARVRVEYAGASTRRPVAHFGIMGSGNTVMKSGKHRDQIARTDRIIGFEMEGAGVWDYLPSIVIKGVCDYADSHKRKGWQCSMYESISGRMECGGHTHLFSQSIKALLKALPEPVFYVPFDRIPGFVGRTDELKRLQERAFDPEGRRIVALLGLGGIGKSRLALELLYHVKSEHPDYQTFWIQASDQLTFEKDVREIGKKLGIPGIEDEKADITTLVKQRLSNSPAGRWLLILENADDESLWQKKVPSGNRNCSLVDWFPSTTYGSVLITTRSRRVASYLAGREVVELSAMSADQGRLIFTKMLEKPELADDQDATSTLLEKLTFLLLAIETVNTYLDLLDEPEEEVVKLLSEGFGDQSRYANAENPVASTWLISFEQIRKNNPVAAQFLSSMACLHEKNIPLSLLPEIDSKKDVVDAMATLRGYSFVTRQTQNGGDDHTEVLYDMHRLVHLAARNWLKMNGTLPDWTKDCIRRMSKLFPSETHKYKSIWTIYLPHAQRLCRERCVEDVIERVWLLNKMGSSFRDEGKYNEAVEAYTAVARWMEHRFGVSYKETMMAYGDLGIALSWQGDLSAAELHLGKTLSWTVNTLGKENREALSQMDALAFVLQQKGDRKEAEEMFDEVLQITEKVYGKTDGCTLDTMNNLASLLTSKGNYFEAEKIQREALHLRVTTCVQSHPDTLVIVINLAFTLRSQGNYREAEKLLREATITLEKVRGKSHPHTLDGREQLAAVLHRVGKYSEAENICRELLDLQETLGKSHPITIDAMESLAEVLIKQGNDSEAESILREVVESRATTLGISRPIIIDAMESLAEVLIKQGNDSEADSIRREVRDLQANSQGKDPIRTLSTPSGIASLPRVQEEHFEVETTSQNARKKVWIDRGAHKIRITLKSETSEAAMTDVTKVLRSQKD